jgi:hypothetical protein
MYKASTVPRVMNHRGCDDVEAGLVTFEAPTATGRNRGTGRDGFLSAEEPIGWIEELSGYDQFPVAWLGKAISCAAASAFRGGFGNDRGWVGETSPRSGAEGERSDIRVTHSSAGIRWRARCTMPKAPSMASQVPARSPGSAWDCRHHGFFEGVGFNASRTGRQCLANQPP